MLIEAALAWVEDFPLSRPYTIAFKQVDRVQNVIVALRTASGLVGHGAAAPEAHVTGETQQACETALLDGALDWLVGCDIRDLAALTRQAAKRMAAQPAARAAIESALYDLLAQYLGIPLVRLLGQVHTALPTSITIGIKSLTETLSEADEYLGRGFRILKVKLGHDLEQDIERLFRLRERVGTSIPLRVDPNQGYSSAELELFVQRTATLDLEFIEQPVAAHLAESLRTLPDAIRSQIALDESLLDAHDALRWLTPPAACGIFNIKLMKCGGITPALQIAHLAELAGIALMWGCMDESLISITAALHTALACPATRYLDLDGSLDLARDIATGGFILKDGFLSVPDTPGLGVQLSYSQDADLRT
ncbi:mandelate racemase/muconate lactonizing enzyme family protein [Gloeobacter kilaueensis]|uniref:Dipeptide epimerase n=1 Tax=Gloeobacter kilaueensis (strain ATCC BAA-2537 / CCAP 1431/1 / ULC 316 / JS1) TaxID=1183438 RepID=U5QEX5_GLOK1|nr:dipeptide epimerase [Gloeobacter kilaueensis]AGY57403.1 mandelate racemase/muconate lactonizing enzyme family protein [Gloeobacter kilaueensis JS1]